MSREISKQNLIPLYNEFNKLYSKYTLLCNIDYTIFESEGDYDKSLYCSAFEIFKMLSDDFESVYHEIKSLERLVE